MAHDFASFSMFIDGGVRRFCLHNDWHKRKGDPQGYSYCEDCQGILPDSAFNGLIHKRYSAVLNEIDDIIPLSLRR